ncbi:MAG: cell division protein FtsA [Rhodospirillaceae bacterium]|uniref:cell division protein FtsA n=1 Tax=Hwanghaeella sp. 1Z406 TaxID=3402811 RepID=UPI000C465BCF|nr:cell division protein FtsA [Rhodospirillales bacterium]MAX48611.1 cell division protein FtsA [Rhodospirillaceae bacterium]
MATRKLTALDIGSTKICCFIAEVSEAGRIRVTGMSHQQSAGLKGGMVVDMESAYRAILSAVHSAEQMAGTTIEDVVLSINGARPHSTTLTREMQIGGGAIRDPDISRLLQEARESVALQDRMLLHAIPIGYSVDGGPLLKEPRSMHAQTVGVKMHVVTANESAVQNLVNCVARCHLTVSDFALAPYAAGLSALVEDEKDLGATVIDMGGGTTSFSVFYEGAAVYGDCIPVGGQHVTSDIARGLSTTLQQAERLKTLYGSCQPAPSDDRELIDAPRIGEEDDTSPNRVPRSFLVSIIAPRLEETFELVRKRMEASGANGMAGQRVVLTGGASQLPGVREMAGRILNKQVRHGRPLKVSGLAEATGGPAFATAAGLLHFAVDDCGEARGSTSQSTANQNGLFAHIGKWFSGF